MRSRKSNNKRYIIIASISVVLLLLIAGVILYKNDRLNFLSDSSKITEQTPQNTTDKSPSLTSGESKTNNEPAKEPQANYIEDQPSPTEPKVVNGILIVNKQFPIPSTYNKGENPEAKQALTNMLAAGKEVGFDYEAFSGFRSFEYQTTLYERYVAKDGKEGADRYSARPGHSEHQTGLAFDIGEKHNKELWLTEEFGETEAGKWLMENAHKYGFILRYPKGKENITGFMYESWHYRYVGVEHAAKIYEQQITLEEYLDVVQY